MAGKNVQDEISRDLIRRAKAGDNEAKEEFFRREYPNLPKVINQYKFRYSSIPHHKLEEMAHTAMLYAYSGYTAEETTPFIGYWRRSMRHRISRFFEREIYSNQGEFDRKVAQMDMHLDGEDSATLGDTITRELADIEEPLDEGVVRRDAMQTVLAEFAKTATPKELDMLKHFTRNEKKSQRKIGKEYGVSQITASRMQTSVLKRLRDIARAHGLVEGKWQPMKKERKITNLGHLKYLFIHTALTNGQIGNLVGVSSITVGKHHMRYTDGKWSGVKEDASIKSKLDAYLSTLSPTDRRKLDEKLSKKPSPVTSYKVAQLAPEEEAPVTTYFLPKNEPEADVTPKGIPTVEPAINESQSPSEPQAPPPVFGRTITVELDKADTATIDIFLATVRAQLKEGGTYRFQVTVEEVG